MIVPRTAPKMFHKSVVVKKSLQNTGCLKAQQVIKSDEINSLWMGVSEFPMNKVLLGQRFSLTVERRGVEYYQEKYLIKK